MYASKKLNNKCKRLFGTYPLQLSNLSDIFKYFYSWKEMCVKFTAMPKTLTE